MEDRRRLHIDIVFRTVDLLVQRRMDDRQVIALEIVLTERVVLPVAVNLVRLPPPEAEAFERHVARLGFERRDGLGQRFGLRVHVDEDESAPAFADDRKEREVARVETFSGPEIARVGETAVERIAPAVIFADQLAFAAAFAVIGQRAGAMAADVVKSTELPAFSADNDQRIACHTGREITACLGQLAFMGDEKPGAGEDCAALDRMLLGAAIKRGVEGFGGDVGFAHRAKSSGDGRSCEAGGRPLPLRDAIPLMRETWFPSASRVPTNMSRPTT